MPFRATMRGGRFGNAKHWDDNAGGTHRYSQRWVARSGKVFIHFRG